MSGTIGDNVYRASGVIASAAGGGTSWQSVTTGSTLAAVAGNGYPVNTTAQACTVTLPASASVGDTIKFVDYARTWRTNALTIDQNSLNFQGSTTPNPEYNTNGQSVTIVYVDATQGWIPTVDDDSSFETAYDVEYLVVAGGGGGGYGYTGGYYAAGGGGGGYRNSYASENSGQNSSTESVASVGGGATYTITVGAGGAITSNGVNGLVGEDSSFIGSNVSITSSGGGYGQGANDSVAATGGAGGCGGGAANGRNYATSTGGLGTAAQGYDGGDGQGSSVGGGGGGAGAEGADSAGTGDRPGGVGLASLITASSVTRSTGGDGGKNPGSAKNANTGDGGDGSQSNTSSPSAGASGVVILRISDADYSGTTTGSPTIDTSSVADETILIYTGDGSYTA